MSGDTNDGRSTEYGPDVESVGRVEESSDTDRLSTGEESVPHQRATASGRILLRPATIEAIRDDDADKGDAVTTARIGAVQAVKQAWRTIPLCHQVPITNVKTEFDVDQGAVSLTVTVETRAERGCEMEALEGVTTGLNTLWDMVKAAEKGDDGQYPIARIEGVKVVDGA